MKDRELAHRLGEAIRRALVGEHLPKGNLPGCYPRDLLCQCKPDRIVNTCSRRILEAAFKLYANECPERFWSIPY